MKQTLLGFLFVVLFFIIGGLGSYYLLNPSPNFMTFQPAPSPSTSSSNNPTSDTTDRDPVGNLIKRQFPESDTNPKIALVIDDLGWVTSTAHLIDRFEIPVTLAVLPERPHSQSLYNRWKQEYEFILHMPMEPAGYPVDDPGKAALMTNMSSTQIQTRLTRLLDKYPRIAGVNNHMGSAFTSELSSMRALMTVLHKRGLYFLDSVTSQNSVATQVAHQQQVSLIRNNVFLDHDRNRKAVRGQIRLLADVAKDEGWAVGIAHAQSEMALKTILKAVPKLRNKGYRFVWLSTLTNISNLPSLSPASETSR